MSEILIPIFRNEAGESFNPATNGLFNTHCDDGIRLQPKKFKEVFVHWSVDHWVEDLVYISGTSIVALKVINECDDTFSYLNFGFNDFRLDQLCCQGPACPEITTIDLALNPFQFGVPFIQNGQLSGQPNWDLQVVTKPDWMTITLNGSVVEFRGTPDTLEEESVTIYFNSCNRTAAPDSPGSGTLSQIVPLNLGDPDMIFGYHYDGVEEAPSVTRTAGAGVNKVIVDSKNDNNYFLVDLPVGTTSINAGYSLPAADYVVRYWFTNPELITELLAEDKDLINTFSIVGARFPTIENIDVKNNTDLDDITNFTALNSLNIAGTGLGQTQVNNKLIALASGSVNNGFFESVGTFAPTGAAIAAKATLQGRGWTVNTD